MMKLDFECAVEDVNRMVETLGDDVQVNGTTLMVDTQYLEDVFRYLVPSPEVTVTIASEI